MSRHDRARTNPAGGARGGRETTAGMVAVAMTRREAVALVARHIVAESLRDWEDDGAIPADDWAAVEAKVRELAPEPPAEYVDKAYALLTGREP